MTKSSYVTIAGDLVKEIHQGSLKPNDKMPSEAQITIKYGVSRIVASKSFAELLKLGAVYSIPKKGYFVSENFSGMIKPIAFAYGANKVETEMINLPEPKFFKDKRVLGRFKTGVRRYYKDDELIIISHFFVSNRIDVKANGSLINLIVSKGKKVTATTFQEFEAFEAFGNSENLVNTRVTYADGHIPLVERYTVKQKYFKTVKQEFWL